MKCQHHLRMVGGGVGLWVNHCYKKVSTERVYIVEIKVEGLHSRKDEGKKPEISPFCPQSRWYESLS